MVEDDNNFDEIREALDEGLSDGLAKVHTKTLDRLVSNMGEGKDALGRKWAPLDEATIRAKGHSTPLIESGDLRADIQSSSEVDTGALVGIIGTSKEYGAVHELGAPEAGIPRRPFLGPAAIYAKNIAPDIMGEEIDTKLEQAEL